MILYSFLNDWLIIWWIRVWFIRISLCWLIGVDWITTRCHLRISESIVFFQLNLPTIPRVSNLILWSASILLNYPVRLIMSASRRFYNFRSNIIIIVFGFIFQDESRFWIDNTLLGNLITSLVSMYPIVNWFFFLFCRNQFLFWDMVRNYGGLTRIFHEHSLNRSEQKNQ